jgi:putative tricarboxylic transport membrane protein
VTTNALTGLIAMIVGIIYFITALRLPTPMIGDQIGPKLFPYIVGIASIFAGATLFFQDRRPGKASKKAEFNFVKDKDIWIKILLTTVVGIIYGLVMDKLGFLIPTTLFMLFISTLINKGRHVQNLIIALAFAVICYGVFGVALKLSLPRGFLESMLPF